MLSKKNIFILMLLFTVMISVSCELSDDLTVAMDSQGAIVVPYDVTYSSTLGEGFPFYANESASSSTIQIGNNYASWFSLIQDDDFLYVNFKTSKIDLMSWMTNPVDPVNSCFVEFTNYASDVDAIDIYVYFEASLIAVSSQAQATFPVIGRNPDPMNQGFTLIVPRNLFVRNSFGLILTAGNRFTGTEVESTDEYKFKFY